MSFLDLFRAIAALAAAEPKVRIARIVLIFLSFILIDLFIDLIGGPIPYRATFLLGLPLGVLYGAGMILSSVVVELMLLGMLARLISEIGGLIGGYCLYFASGGKYNPVIGIAAVICVPTTAKVAQKEISAVAPGVIVLPEAPGANISGVITTAIIAAIYVSILRGIG